MRKATLIITALVAVWLRSAQADFSFNVDWSSGFANGGVVPDASFTGWSDTRTLSGVTVTGMNDLNVHLTLSGGFNGDLYAYLVHDSGFVVLLNRVGVTTGNSVGYGDAGMHVVFDDQAARTQDIHFYRNEPGYTAADITGGAIWKPDGRNISPISTPSTFASTSPSALLNSFNGINPNGSWTLFLSDLSGGGVTTVTSWGLDMVGVPEPASLIQGSVAALLLGLAVAGYRLKQLKRLAVA